MELPKELQQLYLNLLAAWGDSPLDEEEVKELLAQAQQEVVERERKKIITEVKKKIARVLVKVSLDGLVKDSKLDVIDRLIRSELEALQKEQE